MSSHTQRLAMHREEAGEGAETRPGTGWACRTGAGTASPTPLPWTPPPSAPPPCSVDAGGGFLVGENSFERAGAKEDQMATATASLDGTLMACPRDPE